MKTLPCIICAITCLAFPARFVSAQQTPYAGKTVMTYVESSNGLASPVWESGRSEFEFADMNGDGNIDIITIGDHGNPGIQSGAEGLMIYFGDGQGNWACQKGGNFGYGGVAAGDVNNDGLMDVGFSMHHNYSSSDFGNQLIEVALGDGTGLNWTPWDDGLATNGEDWGMFGTDFADIDNDGDLDIASISFGCCSGIHVYRNNLDGTWTQSFGFNAGNSSMILEFGDINNDGAEDFVADHESGTAYFGDGNGNFTVNDLNLPSLDNIGRNGPSLGDADNDGGKDLAFASYSGGVYVYVFMEDIGEWVNFSGTLPTSGDFQMTQLADMNMDGFVDLAAFGDGSFRVFLGDGEGNWTADAAFSVGDPGSCKAFRVGGDADHNGKPDLVLLEETEIGWFTYQNYMHFYKENSVPVALEIKAVYPRGHELLRPGSVRFLEWISAVPDTKSGSEVTLAYSATGPDGPWTTIASNVPDNGRYQWIVPQENSSNCYIQYTLTSSDETIHCITPAAFTITNGAIGIKDKNGMRLAFSVYPNPAVDQLAVGSQQSAVRIEIVDIYGNRVAEYKNIYTMPYNMDVSGLAPGMYFLSVINEDGIRYSSRFMKVSH